MDKHNENINMSHGPRRRQRRAPRPNQPQRPTQLINSTVSVDAPQDQALSQHLLRQNQELKLQLEREQERNQASQEELLTQIENLKLDVERDPGEIWAFKSRHQAQCEHWMEYTENQHKKELEEKDKVIRSLEEKADDAFRDQVQEAKEAVEDELRNLSERNVKLEIMLDRREKRAQRLLDVISETSRQKAALRDQITALQQELQQEQQEQQEKESLRTQVTQLQSDLSERDQATLTAQRHVEQLETETQKLSTTVDSLTSALNQEKCLTSEAERKMQEKERETLKLKTQVSALRSALDQEQQATREAQTSQTALQQLVEELKEKLQTEQAQIRAFKAQCENVQNEHLKELEAKECEITHLKQQKASVFAAQVEEAREAVWAEIADLKVANFDLEEELMKRDEQTQALQDTITQRSKEEKSLKYQVTELRQALHQEKQETEALWSEVEELKNNQMQNTTESPACNRDVWEVLKEKLQQLHREQLCSEKQSRLILEQQVQKLSEDLTSSQDYNTALELQVHELQDEVNGLHKKKKRRSRSCHDSVKLIKFADDTTLIGLISNNDESAYRREVDRLVSWCSGNNLELNAQKTVEMIVDFRKSTVPPPPPSVMDSPITSVESFRFLGTTITQDLKWEPTISSLIKKAQQRMYFLRQLRKAKLPAQMLVQFYTAIIESVLTSSITVWFAGATVRDKQRLQRIVRSAEEVIGRSLPSLQDLLGRGCQREFHSASSAMTLSAPMSAL
uniref:Alkylated DNA repair protein AlkB homologue 8 N-terminal domain-containing protein n=1 Tax=Knipowitschia caucasica TaxID=637954 RepID=A0AAV2LS28_KNICA